MSERPVVPCCMGSAVYGKDRCTCIKPAILKRDFIKKAEVIVRGTQDSGSGWYNSPDDLVDVIAAELQNAYEAGRNRGR